MHEFKYVRCRLGIMEDEKAKELKKSLREKNIFCRSRKTKYGRSVYLFFPFRDTKTKDTLAIT